MITKWRCQDGFLENSKALNTVFVGAVLKVLNLKIAEALKVIKEHFAYKKL